MVLSERAGKTIKLWPKQPFSPRAGLAKAKPRRKKAEQSQGETSVMTAGSNLAPHIDYDDLREWLALAGRLGEVKIVRGAT